MADSTSPSPRFSESVLHKAWKSGLTGDLTTDDGRHVVILSPGQCNSDEGPDFTDARLIIGGQVFVGDVEIHMDAAAWSRHGHDTDPHYNRTILHVVLRARSSHPGCRTESGRVLPLLVLEGQIGEEYLRTAKLGPTAPPPLRCFPLNSGLDGAALRKWIIQLAWQRMELRVQLLGERLRQLVDERTMVVREPGQIPYEELPLPTRKYSEADFLPLELWDQLLYEGIMEGMGYSKNRRPFVQLSRAVRLDILRRFDLGDSQTMMAILFGAAGLLPSVRSMADIESRIYLHSLRSRWRELSQQFNGARVHPGEWKFFRTRPVNFPTARLAALVYLLPRFFRKSSLTELTALVLGDTPPVARRKLRALFSIRPDQFWQTHYRFSDQVVSGGVTFGRSRRDDIVFNSVLPILLLSARIFDNGALRAALSLIVEEYPPLQKNPVIDTMQMNLARRIPLDSAILQQGAIRLYKSFCLPQRCGECSVGRALGLVSVRDEANRTGHPPGPQGNRRRRTSS